MARYTLLSGGLHTEFLVFDIARLRRCYSYKDGGDLSLAVDLDQMLSLNHLATLAGSGGLSVQMPLYLKPADSPCLTLDRLANVAVYTGEEPCGQPGKSSVMFRPCQGDDIVDVSIIEQLIAPILEIRTTNGTAVFDAMGTIADPGRVRQDPDEIIMFCVDCSASMRACTSFDDRKEDDLEQENPFNRANARVYEDFKHFTTFDKTQQGLLKYESFGDLIAIIRSAKDGAGRREMAEDVWFVLTYMLTQQRWSDLNDDLINLEEFYCGLLTHYGRVVDFLLDRSEVLLNDTDKSSWFWSDGDPTPFAIVPQHIPMLPSNVLEVPEDLRCPISHILMEDPVIVADGNTYCRSNIERWFSIKLSSPLLGTALESDRLTPNQEVCDAIARWIRGDDIVRSLTGNELPQNLKVIFDSQFGSFTRSIPTSTTLEALYKLAFRGLKGKHLVFQLFTDLNFPWELTTSGTVGSRGFVNKSHISIRIADDNLRSSSNIPSGSRPICDKMCLVKVYKPDEEMLFGYWTSRDSPQRMSSVLWKWFRYEVESQNENVNIHELCHLGVYTGLKLVGDGISNGTYRSYHDMIGPLFTPQHCCGKLGAEELWEDDIRDLEEYLDEDMLNGDSDDDSYSQSEQDDHQNPDQYDNADHPLVLKVQVFPRPFDKGNSLTRLDLVKNMFESFINRLLAYEYNAHVGVINFSSRGRIAVPISHILENLRQATRNFVPWGDTALWDTLAFARDQIEEYAKAYPSARKRIIVLSDGDDTSSKMNTCQEICFGLIQKGIVVDSICLGNDEPHMSLRGLSHVIRGYAFHPTRLIDAITICEMEPFLSLADRPVMERSLIQMPFVMDQEALFQSWFEKLARGAQFTTLSDDDIPPCREHPSLSHEFMQLSCAALGRGSRPLNCSRVDPWAQRVMREIQSISSGGGHPKYDIYVSETDMSFWKIIMRGPEESPYAKGTFMLWLHADKNYPANAPKVRFVTQIKHPNISPHGRICHSLLGRDWTSDTSMTSVLDAIFGLLYQPEHSDTVQTVPTLNFHHDEVSYAEEVRSYVWDYAYRSRHWYARTLVGVQDYYPESNEDDYDGGGEDLDSDGDVEMS
ncbi:hypothetical protein F5Y16DRAFT_422034 [Xylariaceae sp. FL0255]|nr:hypothetical protein F5Y16DRAFT_422034 [Xylariaceae sp. FL0255]